MSLSALASLDVVATTGAPSLFANCTANSETPPVPCVRTTEPGLTAPCSTTAVHAVSAAQGNVAAVSVETDGGRGASADSAIVIASRRTPSPGPPSALVSFAISGSPAIQPGKKEITTLSPGLTRAHPGPTASTVPAPSEQGTTGRFWRGL